LIGRYAVKVPSGVEFRLFLLGLLANIQERKFNAMNHPKMARILFSIPGGWLSIMRKADLMSRQEWDTFDPEEFCKAGDFTIPAEPKLDSFGYIDGALVAIDYG